MPARPRHLVEGDKLGKYEVIRRIALGSMAELSLARMQGGERFDWQVVVKRILPQHASSPPLVAAFRDEARIAAALHHPNLVPVHDLELRAGDDYYAMQYVHGVSLDRVLRAARESGRPIAMDAALTIVVGLCAGLHCAHETMGVDGMPLQIVHRDVCPSNLLVGHDGSVKLLDFASARPASQQLRARRRRLKGELPYLSPEQARSSNQLDRRSDIFSVGVLLYRLTVGRLPFDGQSEYQLRAQIGGAAPPPPRTFVPDYPLALERFVMRALAREAEHRYPTALALQADLEDFAHAARLRLSGLELARVMGALFPTRSDENELPAIPSLLERERRAASGHHAAGTSTVGAPPRAVSRVQSARMTRRLTTRPGDSQVVVIPPITRRASTPVHLPRVSAAPSAPARLPRFSIPPAAPCPAAPPAMPATASRSNAGVIFGVLPVPSAEPTTIEPPARPARAPDGGRVVRPPPRRAHLFARLRSNPRSMIAVASVLVAGSLVAFVGRGRDAPRGEPAASVTGVSERPHAPAAAPPPAGMTEPEAAPAVADVDRGTPDGHGGDAEEAPASAEERADDAAASTSPDEPPPERAKRGKRATPDRVTQHPRAPGRSRVTESRRHRKKRPKWNDDSPFMPVRMGK